MLGKKLDYEDINHKTQLKRPDYLQLMENRICDRLLRRLRGEMTEEFEKLGKTVGHEDRLSYNSTQEDFTTNLEINSPTSTFAQLNIEIEETSSVLLSPNKNSKESDNTFKKNFSMQIPNIAKRNENVLVKTKVIISSSRERTVLPNQKPKYIAQIKTRVANSYAGVSGSSCQKVVAIEQRSKKPRIQRHLTMHMDGLQSK
ncbi:hypothetical protein HHI36_015287 [Cryptolaemus montrouzieri]|uniref:Uncharacterized protein n=1 Tax=Cryptolaemus montrouzieri TaxID=559131 RepID=A0ABD2N542_9CUCU